MNEYSDRGVQDSWQYLYYKFQNYWDTNWQVSHQCILLAKVGSIKNESGDLHKDRMCTQNAS
jgi:hypothetical protein